MILQRRWYRMVLLLLAFAGAAAAATAAVPNPPSALRLSVDQLVFGQPARVHVMWPTWDHNGSAPIEYHVYRAAAPDSASFDSVGTATPNDISDTSNMMQEFVDEVGDGTYWYYVVAANADGASGASSTQMVRIAALGGTIAFTSIPPGGAPGDSLVSYGAVGQLYSYSAHAAASNNSAVQYELSYGPTGMTIDGSSGLLHWTPDSIGTYYVLIKASLVSDTRVYVYQSYQLRVRACAQPTIVYGRVVDGNGNGIDNVNVVLTTAVLSSEFQQTYTAGGGYYAIIADAGTYLLHADGNGIVAEWYQDSYDRGLATPVTLACGDSTVANFTVEQPGSGQNYTVSGYVTSSNGNQAIDRAVVEFIGFSVNVPDSVKWESSIRRYAATNNNGAYEISLSNQYRYVAHVSQVDSLNGGAFYTTRYYNQTNDPTQAATIELTGNMTNVDFKLDKLPNHTNGINGYVRDSAGAFVPAIVVAYRVTSHGANATVEAVQSGDLSNTRGSFFFNSLPPGEYVIYAIPQARVYLPGYHTTLGNAVLTWQEATQIHVTGTSQSSPLEIILARRAGVPGRARLHGVITANTGHTIKVDRAPAGFRPVVGAMVAAVDVNTQTVSNYAYTDQEGRFEITGLGEGQYRVVADKVGYGAYTDNATIAGATESVNHDIKLESLSVSSVPTTGAGATMELAVYPNPASSQVNLRLAGAHGTALVVVTNLQGEEVLSAQLDQIGAEGYVLNADGLANGIYFVRMQAGSVSSQAAVRIVR